MGRKSRAMSHVSAWLSGVLFGRIRGMKTQSLIYTERFVRALLSQPDLYARLPYYPPRPFDAYEKYAMYKPFRWDRWSWYAYTGGAPSYAVHIGS